MWRKGNPRALLVGMQTGAAAVENSMEDAPKPKNRTTLGSSNSAPGYLSTEIENTNSKRYMHLYVSCRIIYNSQGMEASQLSINRWMDKEDVVYTYNAILAIKKNDTLPFATTRMDLEGITLSEISQTEKDKHYVISLICGI